MSYRKVHYSTIIKTIVFYLIVSCSSSENQQGAWKKETYHINPTNDTTRLQLSHYNVDSICPLNFPDKECEIGATKIFIQNDRIYFLDSEISKALYLFDFDGNLIKKIGERGKAGYEFLGKPDDFFVDSNNKLHVYDKLGQKVIVFNDDGSLYKVAEMRNYSPHSIGLTGNGKYVMYYNYEFTDMNLAKDLPPSLLVFDHDFKCYKQLVSLESSKASRCQISDRSFFQTDSRLSHIPAFSDSVIVFRNDTLEKVILFDFEGNVLSRNNPELLEQQEDYSFLSNYQGVLGLNRYEEDSSLVYLDYIYNNQERHWLYNKNTKHMVNGAVFFEGINPYSYYFLHNNQVVAFVCEETVNGFRKFLDKEEFQINLKKSPRQIKDLMEDKTKAPALFFFTIQ